VWLAYIVLGIALVGTLSSNVFLVLAMLGAAKFHREARRQRLAAEAVTEWPGVSLLKPVHGREVRLKENIESFFHQDYPEYEILFAADTEENEALGIVREVCARYPNIRTQVIVTGRPPWLNPPAYSFYKMAALAAHDILVTSDSDVEVQPNYLREVVPPMLDPKVGMLTCIYRGKNVGGFWSAVHAVGMSVEMTAGVVTANLLEGMKFGLGPTIVVRRDALEVLVEGPSRTDPERLRGRTRHNKVVNFRGLAGAGEMAQVRIEAATSQTLSGEEQLLARAGAAL